MALVRIGIGLVLFAVALTFTVLMDTISAITWSASSLLFLCLCLRWMSLTP